MGRDRNRVPSGLLMPFLAPIIERDGLAAVAARADIDASWLGRLHRGHTGYLALSTADRLIVRVLGDASLWHTVPELAAIFERAA